VRGRDGKKETGRGWEEEEWENVERGNVVKRA